MQQITYIGIDVHKAMTVIAVLSSDGQTVAEGIVETKGAAILDLIKVQRGTLHVTCKEGTQAAWRFAPPSRCTCGGMRSTKDKGTRQQSG